MCARAHVGVWVCVYQDLISSACVAAYFPFSGVGHKVLRPWPSESWCNWWQSYRWKCRSHSQVCLGTFFSIPFLSFVLTRLQSLSYFRYNVAIKCATITPGIHVLIFQMPIPFTCVTEPFWFLQPLTKIWLFLFAWQAHDCSVDNWQMKLVSRNLSWNRCGRVQMGQSGIFWMVSELPCMNSFYCCFFSLTLLIFIWWPAGTVFREPIICKNVPRLIPGICCSLMFKFNAFHGAVEQTIVIGIVGRLDKAHMHWQACFWWSISSNWYSYSRTRQT